MPGGKDGKGGKDAEADGFAALLARHLNDGTRPGLKVGTVGAKWTAPAFGKAVGATERTVRNWRSGSTLPNGESLGFIVDALFGDDPRLAAEQRALQDSWDAAQLRRAGRTLAAAEPEPDGLIFVEGERHLEIQQAAPSDREAARDAAVPQRLRLIAEKLDDLVEAIGARLDNQRGWRGLPRRAHRLREVLHDLPPEGVPERLVELYDRTISLASFVELDDRLGVTPSAAEEPLDPDIRRALVDVLSSLAPWLRSFPTVVTWDSARKDMLTRPELFAAVRAQLQDAKELLSLATEAGVLSAEDGALAAAPLETAGGEGMQAEKAGHRALSSVRNLLTRSVGLKAMAVAAGLYTGAVASDFATKSELVKSVGSFLARGEAAALRIASGMAEDARVAVAHVLGISRRRDEDRSGDPGSVTVPPPPPLPRDPPPDFEIEKARRMILAGRPPPAAWVPFIEELDLDDTDLADLAPIAALSELRSLRISQTRVADLTPIAGLDELQLLHLDHTEVTDSNPLARLANLQHLSIANTWIENLAGVENLVNLHSLALDETNVKDLTPISGLANLRALVLRGTPVADLAPIAGLSNLGALSLNETRVVDLSPISGLVGLQALSFSDTRVSELAPVAKLTNLRNLYLQGTPVADLTPLAALAELQHLYLDHSAVTDLTPVSKLIKLQYLWLDNTEVADLAPIAGLANLQTLSLNDTQVVDLAPIAGLANLQTLAFNNTQVADLAPIAGLANLQTLYLDNTQVDDLAPIAGLDVEVHIGGEVIQPKEWAREGRSLKIMPKA